LLSENANGLLIFRDELAGFLNSLDKLGHETDRAFYLESWNGSGRFVYDRIGRGTVDIEAACVSLLGGIQPGPLQGYLSGALSGQHGDDGLMQRFQLAVWPSVKANWQNVDRLPDAKSRENAFARLVELSQLLPEAYGAEMDNHSPFPFLRFDAEAQELFTQWRTELEHKLRSSQEHPAIVAHLAKYRSLIPSLALLCHLVDGHIGPVRVGALERACAWGDFLEAHALKIYGYTIRQDYDAASRLLKRIKKGDLSNPFTTRDVYRNGWTGLTTVETAQRAIDALEDLGYVQSAIQQTPGRQKTIYWIHPMVMDGQFL
jgi:putative DNA primase/helicase